ncbi:hypothetical protein CRENBAI_015849, partial [Crenichthys baileyi]
MSSIPEKPTKTHPHSASSTHGPAPITPTSSCTPPHSAPRRQGRGSAPPHPTPPQTRPTQLHHRRSADSNARDPTSKKRTQPPYLTCCNPSTPPSTSLRTRQSGEQHTAKPATIWPSSAAPARQSMREKHAPAGKPGRAGQLFQ